MDEATTGNPVFLTLGAAARTANVAKSTISKAIRSGKLSAERCVETGSFRIHVAELDRYMSAVAVVRENAVAEASIERPATGQETPETRLATLPAIVLLEERKAREIAEAKLALAETRLADLKALTDTQIADLRATLSCAATATSGARWRSGSAYAVLSVGDGAGGGPAPADLRSSMLGTSRCNAMRLKGGAMSPRTIPPFAVQQLAQLDRALGKLFSRFVRDSSLAEQDILLGVMMSAGSALVKLKGREAIEVIRRIADDLEVSIDAQNAELPPGRAATH